MRLNRLGIERIQSMATFTDLKYNPDTGVLHWMISEKRIKKGAFAGTLNRGYLRIKVAGKTYKAHRIAWFLTYGKWPDGEIDHINGDRADNRIVNLRDVSRMTNTQNLHAAKAHNKSSGLLGVTFNKNTGRWIAALQANKKEYFLGTHKTAQEAHNAYIQKKRELHIGCTI